MRIKFGHSIADIIRYVIIAIISGLVYFFTYRIGAEWLIFFTCLVFTSAATIELRLKPGHIFPIITEIILCIIGTAFGLYISATISLIGHYMMVEFGIPSILLFSLFIHGLPGIIPGALFCFGLYALLRCLKIPAKISAFITPLPVIILSLANYFVFSFRGNELTPADFSSWRTAMNVAGGYKFSFWHPFCLVYAPVILWTISLIRLSSSRRRTGAKPLLKSIIFLIIALISFASLILGIKEISKTKEPQYWGDKGATMNGYITNFCLLLNDYAISAPPGYSTEEYEGLFVSAPYATDYNGSRPDIIVIMNESFSDLRIYEDILGEYDNVLPYFDSLSEGTEYSTAGYAYASVFGGNTANSEFEFLTSLPTAGLPYGTIPYSIYISSPIYSLPRYLSELGYATTAMHPFYQNSWNRTKIYPLMGFDNMLFIDDFYYSDKDLIRVPSSLSESSGCMSDECSYSNLLDLIDNEDDSTPHFYFMVTIQNHGGYELANEREAVTDYISGLADDSTEQSNVFLTNMRRSDDAFNYLLEELSSRDGEFVVLMFGDHQPMLPGVTDSISDLPGSRSFMVPYVLWTNFELPASAASGDSADGSAEGSSTSINYLALDILNAAGLPLSDYYQVISNIRTYIPIINTTGYYSSQENSWMPPITGEMENEDANVINSYYGLRYYSLFDYDSASS